MLKNISDIAKYIGVSPLIILGILKNAEKHYRTFTIRKRSGGIRTINAPRTYLKVIQWWIYDVILAEVENSPYAHGFVKGRSFIANATFHHGSRYVVNVDIKDFFPSVPLKAVIDQFLTLGYRSGVAEGLARLATLGGALPQGAPTSPALANMIFSATDGLLAEIANRHSAKYSRYADDLTFSSHTKIDRSLIGEVQECLAGLGMNLNEEKTRFMGPNMRLEITGLILGRDGVALSSEFLNSARGWFHTIEMNASAHLALKRKVEGTINLIRQVGGRGTPALLAMGQRALAALTHAKTAT
ncbi:MAG: reverse transcriptase family protein [Sphingomonas bacterium]|nr:reverse transcriptase family protein [Sphingomonas bacterium]